MARSVNRWIVGIIVAILIVSVVAIAWGVSGDSSKPTPTDNGVTRTAFGQTQPANAPGQTMYLQQVTIAPGAKLPEHYHQGTQLARVMSGELTYNIVSGTAIITHNDGSSEPVPGPKTVMLGAGETVTEDTQLVHFGANAGPQPVVIELAALLADGAPLATATGR